VRFFDGVTAIGTAPIVAGSATLAFVTTHAWARSYSAKYLGDERHMASRTDALGYVVQSNVVGVPGETTARPALAVLGLRPNPVVEGDLQVEFSLAGDAPARIDLIDVRGRSVLQRDLGDLPAGSHRVALPSAGLAPGVYIVRLSQHGRARSARVVVVHGSR